MNRKIEYKIQKLIEETMLHAGHSPFQLREEIKKGNSLLKKKDKILNNIKELEKRIDKLKKFPQNQKELKKTEGELRKQINLTNSQSYNDFGLVDHNTLKSILNIKKLKEIGSGYTSIVFKDPIEKNKVLVFTLDETKVKWMQANKKLFNFQMIDSMQYNTGNILYIYSIEKLDKTYENDKMSKHNMKMIYDDVITKYFYLKNKKGFSGIKTKDLDYILTGIDNIELKTIIEKLKKTFGPNETLDLHRGQWGENKKGEIILFDPIISEKTLNSVDELNKLELKTEFTFMLENIFSKTNSAYLKKIRDYLKK